MRRRDCLPMVLGLGLVLTWVHPLPCLAQVSNSTGDRRPAIPVHEAYLPPEVEEVAATTTVPPPQLIASMAGARPGPAAVWIDGYWDFDAASQRFVWVEGVWRIPPPGRLWVVGYWARAKGAGYERIAGYWADERRGSVEFNGPPASRPAENPGESPGADRFYIAGHYVPKERGVGVQWRPGYWSKIQPGWNWVASAWLKRPAGWAYQEGYWIATERMSNPPRGERQISLTLAEAERLARLQGIASAANRALTVDPNGSRSVLNDVTRSMNSVLNVGPGGLAGSSAGVMAGQRGMGMGGAGTQTPAPGVVPGERAGQVPGPTYYIGRSAEGSTYPSYSTTPTTVLGQSTFVGRSALGSSYPSYSASPTGIAGQTSYIGNSAPGSTYPSYSTSGTSVGGYGIGASGPGGSTGGQVGTVSP